MENKETEKIDTPREIGKVINPISEEVGSEDSHNIKDINERLLPQSHKVREVKIGSASIRYSLAMSGYGEGTSDESDFNLEWDEDLYNELIKTGRFSESDDFTLDETTSVKLAGFNRDGEPGQGLVIPSGVTAIYGLTSSGKSELLKVLARGTGAEFIRFHEPELPAILSIDELFHRIGEFLESDKSVLAIDSLRYPVFNTNGRRAAGKGGISSAFYSDLTALSVLARYLGKIILVVINPMSDDSTAVATIAHALEGSITGVMQSKSYGSFRYVARSNESQRVPSMYTFNSDEIEGCSVEEDTKHTKFTTVTIETSGQLDAPKNELASQFARLF